MVYLYEPSLIKDPHYDVRHWRFVWQSLEEMSQELESYDCNLLVALEEADSFFELFHQRTMFRQF